MVRSHGYLGTRVFTGTGLGRELQPGQGSGPVSAVAGSGAQALGNSLLGSPWVVPPAASCRGASVTAALRLPPGLGCR